MYKLETSRVQDMRREIWKFWTPCCHCNSQNPSAQLSSKTLKTCRCSIITGSVIESPWCYMHALCYIHPQAIHVSQLIVFRASTYQQAESHPAKPSLSMFSFSSIGKHKWKRKREGERRPTRKLNFNRYTLIATDISQTSTPLSCWFSGFLDCPTQHQERLELTRNITLLSDWKGKFCGSGPTWSLDVIPYLFHLTKIFQPIIWVKNVFMMARDYPLMIYRLKPKLY